MFSYISSFFKSVYYGTLNLFIDYDGNKIRNIKKYFQQPLNLELKSQLRISKTGKRYMTLEELENINLSGDHTFDNARKQEEFKKYHISMFEKHSKELSRIYRGRNVIDFNEEFKNVNIFNTGQPLLKYTIFTDKNEKFYRDFKFSRDLKYKIYNVELNTSLLYNYRVVT
jgi:hypothetical protein